VFFVATGTIPFHQLKLQMIQGIEVWKSIANGACEQRILFQQRGLSRDRKQGVNAGLPFRSQARENRFA
jgi:hypothetical protein